MNLSSPNNIIWEYFSALRSVARHAEEADGPSAERQYAAIAVMLSMTVIDAFLNGYFRVAISEAEFAMHQLKILKEIRHKSIEEKLKAWPKVVFGKPVDTQSTAFHDFQKLKTRRNELVHFKIAIRPLKSNRVL